MIQHQYHESFKTFTGPSLDELGHKAAAFVEEQKLAAKSISVIAGAKGYLLTIGYREHAEPYAIAVKTVSLGAVALTQLDAALNASAATMTGKVICHDLIETSNGEFLMVFLLHV